MLAVVRRAWTVQHGLRHSMEGRCPSCSLLCHEVPVVIKHMCVQLARSSTKQAVLQGLTGRHPSATRKLPNIQRLLPAAM